MFDFIVVKIDNYITNYNTYVILLLPAENLYIYQKNFL
jgi:hypothetical protein